MNILSPQARHFRFCFALLQTAGRLLLVLAAVVLQSTIAAAQAGQSSEYEAKARNLFNFTKFVEWPDSSFDDPQAPLVFGIMGSEPWFGLHLRRIAAAEKVQGRDVVIRAVHFGDDARRCHVLFVGASERRHIGQILASLQSASVLTVSDIQGFADAGGAVEILMEQDRAHFVVNLDVAMQGKLRVSSKLLALAHVVNHSQTTR